MFGKGTTQDSAIRAEAPVSQEEAASHVERILGSAAFPACLKGCTLFVEGKMGSFRGPGS